MKIKIIDFGLPENHRPLRSHANDAGADVYMPFDCTLEPWRDCKNPAGLWPGGAGWLCRLCIPQEQPGGKRGGLRAAPCGFRLPRRDPRHCQQCGK